MQYVFFKIIPCAILPMLLVEPFRLSSNHPPWFRIKEKQPGDFVYCTWVDIKRFNSADLHLTLIVDEWRFQGPVVVPGHQIIQTVFLCQAAADGTSAYLKSPSALHLAAGWQGVVQQHVAAKWQADLRLHDVMSQEITPSKVYFSKGILAKNRFRRSLICSSPSIEWMKS